MTSQPKIVPVILSGGAGSRLWPLSRKDRAKQFLPLVSDQTMIQDTVARFQSDRFHDPVFICNTDHVDLIKDQIDGHGALILEPEGRNTGPCAMVAALHSLSVDPDALLLLAAADHHIAHPDRFLAAIETGAKSASEGYHVTFGMTPDHPATGFGYIEQGANIADGVFSIQQFKEKPDEITAAAYLKDGGYLWNSGIFLLNPKLVIDEMLDLAPQTSAPAKAAFETATRRGRIIDLDAQSFADCKPEPIDIALMERTAHGAVVPCDLGWADIGSFSAYRDIHAKSDETVIFGDGLTHNATAGLIDTDGPFVAVVGLENVGVIVRDGRVLVIDLDQSQDVKSIVTTLKSSGRTDKL